MIEIRLMCLKIRMMMKVVVRKNKVRKMIKKRNKERLKENKVKLTKMML